MNNVESPIISICVICTITPGCNLRAYFLPVAKEDGASEAEGGELKRLMVPVVSNNAVQLWPTKRGIILSTAEWLRMWESQDEMEVVAPEMDLTDYCLASGVVHENQLECLDCN